MSNQPAWQDPAIGYQSANIFFPPIRSRAKLAIILLIAMIITSALAAPALFAVPWINSVAVPGAPRPSPGTAAMLVLVGLSMCFIAILQSAASISFIVFFCMWMHGTNKTARMTGAVGMEFTPGWAVGWFFVPIANLLMPFRVMCELWKTSDPAVQAHEDWRVMPVPAIIGVWWALWICSGFVAMSGALVGLALQKDGEWPKIWLQLCGTAMQIVASLFLLSIIRQITDRMLTRSGQSPA